MMSNQGNHLHTQQWENPLKALGMMLMAGMQSETFIQVL